MSPETGATWEDGQGWTWEDGVGVRWEDEAEAVAPPTPPGRGIFYYFSVGGRPAFAMTERPAFWVAEAARI